MPLGRWPNLPPMSPRQSNSEGPVRLGEALAERRLDHRMRPEDDPSRAVVVDVEDSGRSLVIPVD